MRHIHLHVKNITETSNLPGVGNDLFPRGSRGVFGL